MTTLKPRGCPVCHGEGEFNGDGYDDAPEPCGWCSQSGSIADKATYYAALAYLSACARRRRRERMVARIIGGVT